MWRVFIIHVLLWAFADASCKTWMNGDTPHLFSAQEVWRERERSGKMRKLEHVGNEFDRQTGMSGLWNSFFVC